MIEHRSSRNRFCISLEEFCICESCYSKQKARMAMESASSSTNMEPPMKLSLGNRFSVPVADNDMTEIVKGKRPANTARATSWAMNTFQEWKKTEE